MSFKLTDEQLMIQSMVREFPARWWLPPRRNGTEPRNFRPKT
jgi:hypothetical protein